jgi:hypothetical protein
MVKTKDMPAVRSRGGSKKGISTVVGMAIFFLIFALGVASVWAWQQTLTDYTEVGDQQIGLDMLRIEERLEVNVINMTALSLENPSDQPVQVRGVVSNNTILWSGTREVPPFSSTILRVAPGGDGTFVIVTMRGNIYATGLEEQELAVGKGAWHVTFRNSSTVPATPLDWLSSNVMGETYWYNTNLNWKWDNAYPFIGYQYLQAGVATGFIAEATLVKVVDEPAIATINYLIDNNSKVAFIIDGVLQQPISGVDWYDQSHYAWFTLNGSALSYHTVSVLFFSEGTSPQKLKLNVVNATFIP